MAAGQAAPGKDTRKGFAGLASLVSQIDTAPPAPSRQERATPGADAAPRSAPAGRAEQAKRPETAASPRSASSSPTSPRTAAQRPPASSHSTSLGKWILGLIVVFGALWGINNIQKPYPRSAYQGAAATPAAQSASTPGQAAAPPAVEKPPAGRDLLLSAAQIRYCLAEEIRLEAAQATLDDGSRQQTDRFNAMVDDYNSRCAQFRYRTGTLESARQDIEPYRGQLEEDGRGRFARPASTGENPRQSAGKAAPDATVQAIQRRLNALGYQAGTVDGLMGRATRSAISAYQKDHGLLVDGEPDAALLGHMLRQPTPRQAPTRPANPARPDGARTPGGAAPAGLPANASPSANGPGWRCNYGYYQAGQRCHPVQVPANASLDYLGSGWQCDTGYHRVGNRCE